MADNINSQDQVVVFRKMKRDSNGYPSEEYEDVFYKEVIVNGKPAFQRVGEPKNNIK
jgi:hypothetical protein